MALVRVYCGLTSADLNAVPPGSETWLTVAVVDDSGRLLDICDISDDAPGFAELGSLLAERSNGLESVAVAADNDDHIVTQLLTAAGRYLAYTDEDSAEDYAERFSDSESADEMQSSPAERRAIGLARALQAGVLSAVAQATPRDLLGLKPVLSAHAAVTTGRQGTAATLREVLRELYPAALRAFPDPAEPIPLAILDALPEPGPLGNGAGGRGRDAQAITELTEAGVADDATVTEAVTALRVAIAETPRRTGMSRSVTSAVAETVRQSVAAVRACDAAAIALVTVLSARMPSAGAPAQQPVRSRRTASEPVAQPAAAPQAVQPAAAPQAVQPAAAPQAVQPASSHAAPATNEAARPTRRSRSQSASVRPRSAPPAGVQPRSAPPAATPTATPTTAPAAPVAPATAAPVAPAAAAGNHRAGAIDPPTEVQPAARSRATRRAAEKQQGVPEQTAATHRQPAPAQTRAPAPLPIHTPPPPPVPVQAPPAAIPAPPPAAAPTPVNPAVQRQPEQVRSQQVPNVPPPPGLTPAYATGQRRDPRSEAPTTSFSVAPGPTPAEPAPSRPAASLPAASLPAPSLPAPSLPSPVSGPPSQSSPGADRAFPRTRPDYPAEAAPRPAVDVPPPGSRANWPLSGEGAHGEVRPESRTRDRSRTGETPRVDFTHSLDLPASADKAGADRPDGRVVPPWQSDDLPAEPPALRLVEPAPLTDPALSAEPPRYREPLTGDPRLEAPPLRLVDRSGGTGGLTGAASGGVNGTPAGPNGALNGAGGGGLNSAAGGLNGAINGAERSGRRAGRKASTEQSEPPATNEIDEDLLIFAEARSAWFTDHFGEEEEKLDFASPSDEGWKAASHAAEPLVGAETQSGLPRRVPQQNLVPGSPITTPERPLRVVRDPAAIAAHTSGYFQGWRRGQEVGGYRVGGRPGRESSGGWDFSRDQGDERDYEYRSARR